MKGREIKIVRLTKDPLCTRVSIGGSELTGYYCVYRGTREEALECIEIAFKSLQAIPEQQIDHNYQMGTN